MSKAPLLEIRNATVMRGQKPVLEHFCLRIEQGEHVAILGPNGAGKTTLVKTLIRELYPRADADTVFRILGRDSWNVWQLRRQIGFVSAELQHRYRESTTVRDVVLSGFLSSIGVHGMTGQGITRGHRERTGRILDALSLTGLAGRPFGTLSTGQQRLVLLGRALVHDPATLVLDEPCAGLDFAAGADVMRRIRALARQGLSLVIVTHHLDEIPPEIERIILLKEGAVLADDSPDRVLTDEALSEAYQVPIRVVRLGDRFFAAPEW